MEGRERERNGGEREERGRERAREGGGRDMNVFTNNTHVNDSQPSASQTHVYTHLNLLSMLITHRLKRTHLASNSTCINDQHPRVMRQSWSEWIKAPSSTPPPLPTAVRDLLFTYTIPPTIPPPQVLPSSSGAEMTSGSDAEHKKRYQPWE